MLSVPYVSRCSSNPSNFPSSDDRHSSIDQNLCAEVLERWTYCWLRVTGKLQIGLLLVVELVVVGVLNVLVRLRVELLVLVGLEFRLYRYG